MAERFETSPQRILIRGGISAALVTLLLGVVFALAPLMWVALFIVVFALFVMLFDDHILWFNHRHDVWTVTDKTIFRTGPNPIEIAISIISDTRQTFSGNVDLLLETGEEISAPCLRDPAGFRALVDTYRSGQNP